MTPFKKIIIFAFILVIAVIIGAGGIWRWQKISKEKENQERILAQKQKELIELKELGEKLGKTFTEEDKQKIFAALPPELTLSDLLRQLQEMAKKSGVNINSINIENTSEKTTSTLTNQGPAFSPGISVISFSIQGEGSYETFKQLLNQIENNLPLMDVVSLSFTPSEGSLTFTLQIEAYVKK